MIPRMNRPLSPLGDVTVSKGFARREHHGTGDALPIVREVMSAVAKPVADRFAGKRRLEPAAVDRSLRIFAQGVDERMLTVASYDMDQPATRTRPKGQYHERCRLAVSRQDDGFRLVAVTMGITCKRVHIEVNPTVASWTRHAAERFYLRDHTASTANAAIGGALSDHFPMLCIAVEAVRASWRFSDLAIPVKGGLLLGEVYDEPGQDWSGNYLSLDGVNVSTGSKPPATTTWREPGVARGSVPCWRAKTFVGPDEMRADQVAYAAAWDALAVKAGLKVGSTLGVDVVAQQKFAPLAVRMFSEQAVSYGQALAALFAGPAHRRVTQRTSPAPPVPYDDEAAWVRRRSRLSYLTTLVDDAPKSLPPRIPAR